MVVVELSFAVSAGVLTAFSPCGVPFLPNLVSFFVMQDRRRLHGGLGSAAFALGLLALLIPLVVVALTASAVLRPYLGQFVLVSGIVTLLMAVAYWKGRSLPIPGLRLDPATSGYRSLFAMGGAYIVAAVGCTPGIFLGVASTAVAAGSLASSAAVLLAFLASVMVPTLILSLVASEYRDAYRERIRRLIGPIQKASLAIMFGLGIYLLVFYVLFTFYGLPV